MKKKSKVGTVPKTPVKAIPAGTNYRIWVRANGKDGQSREFLIECSSQDYVDAFRRGLRGSRLKLTGVLKVDHTQTHHWLFNDSWGKEGRRS